MDRVAESDMIEASLLIGKPLCAFCSTEALLLKKSSFSIHVEWNLGSPLFSTMLIPCCFNYYSHIHITNQHISQITSSHLNLLPENCPGCSQSFVFPYKFQKTHVILSFTISWQTSKITTNKSRSVTLNWASFNNPTLDPRDIRQHLETFLIVTRWEEGVYYWHLVD